MLYYYISLDINSHFRILRYMSNANNNLRDSSISGNDSNVSKPIQSILNISGTSGTSGTLIEEYVKTLNTFEIQGLEIAKNHLGPSFDMKRSSGFLRWKDARSKK